MILSANNVTKRFGDFTALDNVTWGVEAGETKAIIGPNGAGKSTFFNILFGALSPTEGTITFDGNDITTLAPNEIAKLGVQKTYQITNIFQEATVYENIRIAAQVNSTTYDLVSRADNLTKVNETTERTLEQIQMSDVRNETAETLSHGDQRKLEIGIALATDPKIILFDEPTAGMSPEETTETIQLLNELSESRAFTVVITEHDIDFILGLADQISVLHQGSILVEGTPAEITESEAVQEVYLGA